MRKTILIAVSILMIFSCKHKTKTILVNYGKILTTSDSILESYSFSREQDRIEKIDTIADYTAPIIRTRVKYNNCNYYYSNDTLVLDFGKSNRFELFFKLKIHNDTAMVDYRMPAFWNKKYKLSENIDSIYIKLDTLKAITKNNIKIQLYMKSHFPIYVEETDLKFTAYSVFDDTCILRRKE